MVGDFFMLGNTELYAGDLGKVGSFISQVISTIYHIISTASQPDSDPRHEAAPTSSVPLALTHQWSLERGTDND